MLTYHKGGKKITHCITLSIYLTGTVCRSPPYVINIDVQLKRRRTHQPHTSRSTSAPNPSEVDCSFNNCPGAFMFHFFNSKTIPGKAWVSQAAYTNAFIAGERALMVTILWFRVCHFWIPPCLRQSKTYSFFLLYRLWFSCYLPLHSNSTWCTDPDQDTIQEQVTPAALGGVGQCCTHSTAFKLQLHSTNPLAAGWPQPARCQRGACGQLPLGTGDKPPARPCLYLRGQHPLGTEFSCKETAQLIQQELPSTDRICSVQCGIGKLSQAPSNAAWVQGAQHLKGPRICSQSTFSPAQKRQ